jgi:hypothetical protein
MIHHPHGPSAIGNPGNGAYRLSQIAPPQAASYKKLVETKE